MSTICDDLRAAILQAAMQGKLTKQLPKDGNVEDLLEKIKSEKKKLIAEGKIKKQKPLAPITDDETPFSIPENWQWARLGQIFNITAGGTPSRTIPEYWGGDLPWVKIGDMNGKYVNATSEYITEMGLKNSSAKLFPSGTLLYSVFASIGTVSILNIDATTNQAIAGLSKYTNDLDTDYMYYALVSLKDILLSQARGAAQLNINQKILSDAIVPIPPLDEQKRIANKIEKLMARVADLEQSADALASLKKAFPDDIKASLLQAAMQGKLTKQLPEDGSAEDLLEEIKAEKEKLIAEGKVKKQKPLAPITDDEIPFNIPENWKWERFGNLGFYRKGPFGSALTKSIFVKDSANAIKVYEQKNAIKKDASLGDYFISREYYEDKMKSFRVLPGDIIVSCAGTIGETFILPEGIREGIINQALMRMRMFNGIYIPYFLIYFDYIIKASAISNSKGSAIKNIPPFEVLYMYPVAIPPLTEQKRIVGRLDLLIKIVESIEDAI